MEDIAKLRTPPLFGRRKLTTDYESVTSENVLAILESIVPDFNENRKECEYLYEYSKGRQPILARTKEIRPEINNKIVINRAAEIVDFKANYLLNEPIQYIAKNSQDTAVKQIVDYMTLNDKTAIDKDTARWNHICGTTYRMVVDVKNDEVPFRLYHLKPLNTFVVYHNGVEEKPVLGGTVVKKKNGDTVYTLYSDDKVFTIVNDELSSTITGHRLGCVPIVEYPLNEMRMGCFEDVISILNAINTLESNRVDDVEQTIQSLLALIGFTLSDEDYNKLISRINDGILNLPTPNSKAMFLTNRLDQAGAQTLADHLYDTIITLKGIPNRNGGSSTSDTGLAVYFRDGHSQKESNARDTEIYFRKSDQEALKIILRIAKYTKGMNLALSDIEIKFTRRDYENLTTKIDNFVKLSNMVEKGLLDDKSPFTQSGAFLDVEMAYSRTQEYRNKCGLKEGEFNGNNGAAVTVASGSATSNS